MSLTFYFAPRSNANFTVAVLAELEHLHSKTLAKRVELKLANGDSRKPEYLGSVNPNGKVPAIVHDGVPIWESAAITMYLGETYGVGDEGASLYPAASPQRGEAMKWIVWTNVTLASGGQALLGALSTPKDQQSEEQKKAKQDLEARLGILNGALAERPYLLGGSYSLADTHVWAAVEFFSKMQLDLEPYPNVKDWDARIRNRSAIKGAFD